MVERNSKVSEHSIRLLIIVFAFIACLSAATVLAIIDPVSPFLENLKGALIILLPAVIDISRVASREKSNSIRPSKRNNIKE